MLQCELSTCLVCRGLTSPGLRGELCHSPYITSQAQPKPQHFVHRASRAYALSWPECGFPRFSYASFVVGLRCDTKQVFPPSAFVEATWYCWVCCVLFFYNICVISWRNFVLLATPCSSISIRNMLLGIKAPSTRIQTVYSAGV